MPVRFVLSGCRFVGLAERVSPSTPHVLCGSAASFWLMTIMSASILLFVPALLLIEIKTFKAGFHLSRDKKLLLFVTHCPTVFPSLLSFALPRGGGNGTLFFCGESLPPSLPSLNVFSLADSGAQIAHTDEAG